MRYHQRRWMHGQHTFVTEKQSDWRLAHWILSWIEHFVPSRLSHGRRWMSRACFLSFPHIISFLFGIFTGQLKILYEVVSIDGWERERTEGYATMSIPLMSGRFREKIRCYRDVGNDTWIDWLQQYFVGGRRKVRLNEFNGIGSEEDFNRAANGLNRYGNKTETTGYLSIVRNVIVQRHVETRTKSSKMNKSRSRREAKIHSLLFTYQEARERLAAITEMWKITHWLELEWKIKTIILFCIDLGMKFRYSFFIAGCTRMQPFICLLISSPFSGRI